MNVKKLPGTYGFGIVYDKFAGAVYVTILALTFKLWNTHVGFCRHCNHRSLYHIADRTSGQIVWTCSGIKAGARCECDHYAPQSL